MREITRNQEKSQAKSGNPHEITRETRETPLFCLRNPRENHARNQSHEAGNHWLDLEITEIRKSRTPRSPCRTPRSMPPFQARLPLTWPSTLSPHHCSRRHSKENVVPILEEREERVLELAGLIYNHHPIMSFCILSHMYAIRKGSANKNFEL